ncbi:MAG: Rid family detoxifying hydrolase [Bacteroidales bacterium]|jgi:2-iminobutanoate/2-iminopropanoate deaminase|nr:Rid family detoxifying hydrolase [Bacteroidales bacterium]
MKLRKIETPDAPIPKGHYSQAVAAGEFLFISGQLPVVPGNGERITGDIRLQALQVFRNIAAIAEAAGSSTDKIVKVTIYVSDMEHWSAVNEVFAGFFGDHKPARAIVPVKELHYGFGIEADAISVL